MGSERSIDPIGASYLSLLRLSPRKRVIAGLAWSAGGVLLTIFLWGERIIWGLPLFLSAAGVILCVSGLREIKRRKYRQSIRPRAGELIRGMLDVKRRGKNPLEWLKAEGIHDAEIRAELLRAMNKRLKSGRASE